MIYQNESGYQLDDISRDKRWMVFFKSRTTADSDLYLYDRETKETKHLTPHTGDVSHEGETFSPDGKSFYFTTDEGGEFRYLVKLDLATGARSTVERPDWDVTGASFSKSGKYLVVTVNRDARTEIKVLDVATGKRVSLPKLPAGDVTALRIARDDSRMALYLNGSRQPSNLYVCDFKGGAAKQLTENSSPRIDPKWLVDAEVARFRSYDGVEIPGILYKPHQASATTKAPALVWVHGGPGGQTRVNYSGLIQYLVNHGYVVYGINNRGSSGYGKSFFKMDDKRHGEADLDDCVASKKFLSGLGYVDSQRIGIIGGSYGGYMTLAALAFRPQEFVLGVDIFGVSNWVRTLESIPSWWESERKSLYTELGDPAIEGERLRRISPLFHAKNIQRPLMVLQGANDPRVLKVESDEIVAAAKANGVEVNYMVFEDEGHGFRNKKNQLAGYKAILDFCDKHLKNAAVTVGTRN
jgi:dipeptidyl aminopeptidase/acylaminoacyl peptidase